MHRTFRNLFAVAVLGFTTTGAASANEEPVVPLTPPPAVKVNPRTLLVKIEAFEQKLAQNGARFDWAIHNELRHLYGAVDEQKSFQHSDIILKNSQMDGYIVAILSGWELDKDTAKAKENLIASAGKFPEFQFVTAASLLMAGDLEEDAVKAKELYQKVMDLKGEGLDGYKKLAGDVMAKLTTGGTNEDSIRARRAIPRKR